MKRTMKRCLRYNVAAITNRTNKEIGPFHYGRTVKEETGGKSKICEHRLQSKQGTLFRHLLDHLRITGETASQLSDSATHRLRGGLSSLLQVPWSKRIVWNHYSCPPWITNTQNDSISIETKGRGVKFYGPTTKILFLRLKDGLNFSGDEFDKFPRSEFRWMVLFLCWNASTLEQRKEHCFGGIEIGRAFFYLHWSSYSIGTLSALSLCSLIGMLPL